MNVLEIENEKEKGKRKLKNKIAIKTTNLFAAEIESELNCQHCYSDRDNCFMDSRHPRKEHKIKTITKQYAIQ